jgi:two-component system LytT family response regulator
LVVFVTAYTDHAIRAFEAQAVDYLMKPVEESRLADTLDRVRQRLSERAATEEAGKLKEVLARSRRTRSTMSIASATTRPASNRFEKMINIKDRGRSSASTSIPSRRSTRPATTCASTPPTTR